MDGQFRKEWKLKKRKIRHISQNMINVKVRFFTSIRDIYKRRSKKYIKAYKLRNN